MSEVQSFRSLEEANAYIRSHEIATSNRFIRRKSRCMDVSDVTTLDDHRCRYVPKLEDSDELLMLMTDGLPFIHLGGEERECQYGPDYRHRRQQYEDCEDNEHHVQLSTGIVKKKRKVKQTKKVNCRAKVKVKKVLKFPEYFLDAEQRKKKTVMKGTLDKLRSNFSEQTKRYIQLYVQIDHNHCHDGLLQTIKRHKAKTANSAIDEGCSRVESMPKVPETAQVLKKLATLKGKDMMDIALQFKSTSELPRMLAKPKVHQNLEDMDDSQLMMLYYDITGDVPNEMFNSANKEFTSENLRLLLHLCIVFANAAGNEQTHPSVRIKGTENDYTPVQCTEAECATMEPHMHCPFCAMTDSYKDHGLLKAHYTKQHVDKALEFSGLKILRCYDLCEVASKNLDCKTFKGGHWHCYKCSNAYERRPDTLLHYQTHLKEYESSFLVHVAQDVNPSSSYSTMTHEIGNVLGSSSQHDMAAAECLETLYATKNVGGRSPMKRHYADTGLDNATVLYVEEDEMGNVMSTYTAQEITTSGEEKVVVSYTDSPDVAQLKSRILELEINCKKLEKDAILQKSLIAFLVKKNSDQANMHNLEKEKLMEEIVALKGSETIIDDTPEVGTSGMDASMDVQSGDANNLDKYGKASITKFLSRQNCNSFPKPGDLVNGKQINPVPSSVQGTVHQRTVHQGTVHQGTVHQGTVHNSTSSSELSDIKKDIAELKNAFYMTLGGNTRFGTTSGVQNTPQLYFIPNQGITNPSQNIFPQNVTGLVNMNPLNIPSNAGVVNSSLNVPQMIPNMCVKNTSAPGAKQNTDTASASSAKTVQPSASSQNNKPDKEGTSETDKSDTQPVNIENGLGETKTATVESQRDVALVYMDVDEDVLSSSKTANNEPFEVVAPDREAADTSAVDNGTLNANLGNSEVADTAVESTKSASESSPDKVSAETEMLVTETETAETSNASSTNIETSTAVAETPISHTEITSTKATVTECSSTQKDVPSNTKVKETGTSSSSCVDTSAGSKSSKSGAKSVNKSPDIKTTVLNVGNNPCGAVNMPFTSGLQNSAPVVFVPNHGYMAPFIAPQNLTGFNYTPQINPFQTLGATNTLTLNSQGIQNSAPLVFVPNLGGATQYIVPQNNFVGVSTVPGLNTQAVKDLSLNKQQVTSDSASASTTVTSTAEASNKTSTATAATKTSTSAAEASSKSFTSPAAAATKTSTSTAEASSKASATTAESSSTEASSKGQLNIIRVYSKEQAALINTKTSVKGTEPPSQIALTSKISRTGSVTKETGSKGCITVVSMTHRKAPVNSASVAPMTTRLTSKSSGNAGKAVKGAVTVISKTIAGGKDVANANTSTEDMNTDRKDQVVVLSPMSVAKATASKGPVNSKSSVTGSWHVKTVESQTSDKKKVVVLSVKGNVDSDSLSKLLKNFKK